MVSPLVLAGDSKNIFIYKFSLFGLQNSENVVHHKCPQCKPRSHMSFHIIKPHNSSYQDTYDLSPFGVLDIINNDQDTHFTSLITQCWAQVLGFLRGIKPV